ncbi:MAG: NAD(P)/FAD-dependent oxidoreductase [Verrucomicrobiota bacterium]
MLHNQQNEFDVLILGAGGAGLMCAIAAAERGRKVAVLEHNSRIGNKILISGGGRCNFTNIHTTADNYISNNPSFCKSALARYSPWDFIELVEEHQIAYHEKKLGQQFCKESSRQIVHMLQSECAGRKVSIILNTKVLEVRKPEKFEVITDKATYLAKSVVVATGGLSFPKLGASAIGYEIAKSFGLKMVKPEPALVPLTLDDKYMQHLEELSGVAFEANVGCGKRTFRENVLVTHRGLSGPAILQISSYWKQDEKIRMNLFPDNDANAFLDKNSASSIDLVNLLSMKFPKRLSRTWCQMNQVNGKLINISKNRLAHITQQLENWEISPSGTEGYIKAEVTRGGIDTSELSSKTMESKNVPGLFFIGEVVDVTGWLGGYNFQWAWASGHAAGEVA